MEKFKIEMTENEMIRYYANKIVEDGIKDCYEFSNTIDINNYGDIAKYKNLILERIYIDERVADVELDSEGNFDMAFYTDFCPYYYDKALIVESEYNSNPLIKKNLLEEFAGFYLKECSFNSPYISIKNLLNYFTEGYSVIQQKRDEIKNIIKQVLNESNFIEDNIDGIEVYVTPRNYKELERAIEKYIQNMEEQELE